MRRGMKDSWIRRTPEGKPESVSLGWDFTAEHERGIKPLKQAFGIEEDAKPGIERHRATITPKLYVLGHEGDFVLAYSQSSYGTPRLDELSVGYVGKLAVPTDDENRKTCPECSAPIVWSFEQDRLFCSADESHRQGYPHRDFSPRAQIIGAWSDRDWAFRVQKQDMDVITDLTEAFAAKDVAFLFTNPGGNPFSNAGLCLAIISRIPSAFLQGLKATHEDADKLAKAVKKEGMEEFLRKAGEKQAPGQWPKPFGFYALRGAWADDERKKLKYFLNPSDQQRNNSGWYTKEDLVAWTKGEGSIPKP